MRPSPFRVLILGGSYGGLSAALNLLDLSQHKDPRCGKKIEETESDNLVRTPNTNIDITIVDERDGFYHLIGSPMAMASESHMEKFWVKYEDIPALQEPNIHVLHGSVQAVDLSTKTATLALHGSTESTPLNYDYLVTATGLRRVWPVVPQSLRRKQYLFEIGDHLRNVQTAKHGVVVVGGGAVGIEMAAELKVLQPETEVTLVHSREHLLSAEPLPEETKITALELLSETGVNVLLSHRLESTVEVKTNDGTSKCVELTFTNGHTMKASEVVMAVSRSTPVTGFLPAEVLDEEGYVKINSDLTFPPGLPNAADHFAVGDVVKWSGIKRCGGAMHMGYLAATNIHQLMTQNAEFMRLDEIPPMIGLAVGNKALSYWPAGGTTTGEDVMQAFFGKDLGFSICWNYLQLGERI